MQGLDPAASQALQSQKQIWTQAQLKQAHDIANALSQNALSQHPIYSPWEGASRLANALASNIVQGRQAQAEHDIANYGAEHAAGAFGGAGGDYTQPNTAGPTTSGAVDPNEAAAIAHMESNGNYGEIGPRVAATSSHPEGYALGKYQVMNYDLQDRLKAAGLPAMSEQDFLANHDAQEAQFQHEFGNLRQNHSFADAASMWHSGVPLSQATAQNRTDGYMHTSDYVAKAQKFLSNLNPVSPAGAAELTPQALAAAGAARAPTFASRFGDQPQTFDQQGRPLPQGAPPATFGQRFNANQVQGVPTPMPRPGFPNPSAAALAPPAPAIPQVSVTPRSPATGQPMQGAMTPEERAHIFALMREPSTSERGWKLFDEYIAPGERTAITGYKYMGTPGGGFRPLPEPGTPTEMPGGQQVGRVGVHLFPRGSRIGTPYGVETGGPTGIHQGQGQGLPGGWFAPNTGPVNSGGFPVDENGEVDQLRLQAWQRQGWRPGQ
jgi:hypothetical protein